MTKNGTQRKKEGTRELGCRANEREETLITHAAKLDKRTRNAFIISSALAAAKEILQVHGIVEESLLGKPSEGAIRGRRTAA